MAKRLAGKTVLITGASAGIGLAAAREFAAVGCNLILIARRTERIEKLAAELAAGHGITARGLGVDVGDEQALKRALEGEAPDVVICNAGGVVGMDPTETIASDAIDSMINTNVKGLVFTIQAVLPAMKQRGSGHIITVGSISAKQVYPGGSIYCATKHAVNAITRSLRMELLGSGIRVSECDPGMVETEFSLVRFAGDESKAKAVYKGVVPLTGEDVAEILVFMADRPAHVNLADVCVMPSQQATDGPVMVARNT